MALAAHNFTIQDISGNIVTDVQVEVRLETVGQPLVQLFSDRDGTSALGNPFTSATGTGRFHVLGGAYQIRAFNDGFESIQRYVGIGTAAEFDSLETTEASLAIHISDHDNPHAVTQDQVGLDQVNNTSDLDKPISDATQAALDALATGTKPKDPVRIAVLSGTLATDFEDGDTVQSVLLATGDRILVAFDPPAPENGIRVVQASGAPARAADMDASDEFVGALMLVTDGDHAGEQWRCAATTAPVVDTDDVKFVQATNAADLTDVALLGQVNTFTALQTATRTDTDATSVAVGGTLSNATVSAFRNFVPNNPSDTGIRSAIGLLQGTTNGAAAAIWLEKTGSIAGRIGFAKKAGTSAYRLDAEIDESGNLEILGALKPGDGENTAKQISHTPRAEFQVDTTGLTEFGDMTGNGGLAAIHDGETSETGANSAAKGSAADAYAGLVLSSPVVVAGAFVYGSNNDGFLSSSDISVTIEVYGKLGSNPSTSTDGDLIGTRTFTDTADESAGRRISSLEIVKTYDRIWARIVPSASAGTRLAELVLFEYKNLGIARSVADRAGYILSLRDYNANRYRTDNATQVGNFLTDVGEAGCLGIIPGDMGTLDIGSNVAFDMLAPARILAANSTILHWPAGVSTTGITAVCKTAAKGMVWDGGHFQCGADLPGGEQAAAIYFDWADTINPANVDTSTYGTTGANQRQGVARNIVVQGFGSSLSLGFRNGIMVNCGKYFTIEHCNVRGRGSAGGGSTDWPHIDTSMGIGFISRDGIARSISAITLAANPTITYTGTQHPADGAYYFFTGTGMVSLDGLVFECANVNTTAKTFTALLANTSLESAYGGGGSFEGSPQTTTIFVRENIINQYKRALYAGQCEGTHFWNNTIINCLYGIHKQQQIGLNAFNNYMLPTHVGIWGQSVHKGKIVGNNVDANSSVPTTGPEATTETVGILMEESDGAVISRNSLNQIGTTIRIKPIRITDSPSGGYITENEFVDVPAGSHNIELRGSSDNWIIDSQSNLQNTSGQTDLLLDDQSTGKANRIIGQIMPRFRNTTDSSNNLLAILTLKDNTAYRLQVDVTGQQSSGANRAMYSGTGLVYRTGGGGATIEGSFTLDAVESNSAWNCLVNVSGNDVRVLVNGAGANVNWRGGFTILAQY